MRRSDVTSLRFVLEQGTMTEAIESVERRGEEAELALVFDGQCGFCTLAAEWLQGLDERGRLRLVPCQDRSAIENLPVQFAECMAAAWAIEAGGHRHRGGAAIVVALSLALDWQLPRRIYGLWPLRGVIDLGYWMATQLRSWLPGVTPYCKRFPEECRGPSARA